MVTIIEHNAADLVRDTFKVKWNLKYKDSTIMLIILLILSISAVIGALTGGYDFSSSMSWSDETNRFSYTYLCNYNFHFFVGIGSGIFCLCAMNLVKILRLKRSAKKNIEEACVFLIKSNSVAQIKIDETSLVYSDALITVQELWEGFSHYRIHGEYIILISKVALVDSIFINKSLINAENNRLLMEMVQRRLSTKKR